MNSPNSEDLLRKADERRRIAARLEAEAAGLEEAATEIENDDEIEDVDDSDDDEEAER